MLKFKYKSTRKSKAEAKQLLDFISGKTKKLPKGWTQTLYYPKKKKD